MNASITTDPYAFSHRTAAPTSGFGTSLHEIAICAALVLALSVLVWHLFSQMPTYGGQPTAPVATQVQVSSPPPVCFDHTREQVVAEGAPQGCPTDPLAYRPATLHQVNG